jgi:hypothetical protein
MRLYNIICYILSSYIELHLVQMKYLILQSLIKKIHQYGFLFMITTIVVIIGGMFQNINAKCNK